MLDGSQQRWCWWDVLTLVAAVTHLSRGRDGPMLPSKQDEPRIDPRIFCLPLQHGTWSGSNLPKPQSGKIFVLWFCVSCPPALTPPHCRGPQCLWDLSLCCDCGRDMLGTGLLCDLWDEVFAGLGAHSWICCLVRSLPILVSPRQCS